MSEGKPNLWKNRRRVARFRYSNSQRKGIVWSMCEYFALCSTNLQIFIALSTYLWWLEDTDHIFKMDDAGLEINLVQSKEEGGDLYQR